MFAVIKTGGKQYRVAENDVITIEKLAGEAGDQVVFDNVLLLGNGEDTTVGAPMIDGASVAGEIVDQTRGEKIIIFKKKRRKNYRRTQGHRQYLSTVRITEILTEGAKPSKAKATKQAPKKGGSAADGTTKKAAPKKKAATSKAKADEAAKTSANEPADQANADDKSAKQTKPASASAKKNADTKDTSAEAAGTDTAAESAKNEAKEN